MSEPTIRRGTRNARYATIPNHVFEDDRLSMEARWLLGYLLSKPDNWTVRLGDIRKKGGCGKDKAQAMVKELITYGYAEREEIREGGKYAGTVLVVYDEPAEASVAFLPQPDLPAPAKPEPVNPPLSNTEYLAKTESKKDTPPTPLGRGAEACGAADVEDEGEGEAVRPAEAESKAAAETDFWRTFRDYPRFASDKGKGRALKHWLQLAPEARAECKVGLANYLAACKVDGRTPRPINSYVRSEIDWRTPAPASSATKATIDAPAFGPLWGAVRMRLLLDEAAAFDFPDDPRAAAIAAYQTLVRMGSDRAAASYLDRKGLTVLADGRIAFPDGWEASEWRKARMAGGWPAVMRMHDAAKERRAVAVNRGEAWVSELCEPVPIGSATFEAWRDEHERRGWPWLPPTGAMPVVYFPKGGPEGLAEFERALKAETETHEAAE